MSAIDQWSTTAASNNDAAPNGAPEGMAPSGVNDVIREVMAQIRTQWNDAQWFSYLDGDKNGTYAYVASNQFKIVSSPAADLTSIYHVGRRVKVVAATPGTIYGTITASSFSTPDTTVTVSFDSGSLSNEALTASISLLSADNPGLPEGVDKTGGKIFADDGSESAPSYSNEGDSNTGAFFPAANEYAVSTGGTERIRVKSDGTFTGPKLGGWELIESQTPSAVGSADFTTGIDSTYDAYMFKIIDLVPVNDNVNFGLRVRVGGSFQAANYVWSRSFTDNNSSSVSGAGSTSTGTTSNIVAAQNVGSDVNEALSGTIEIFGPSATGYTLIEGKTVYLTNGGLLGRYDFTGAYTGGTGAVDGIRFIFGSGNIESGTIHLYGLRKA